MKVFYKGSQKYTCGRVHLSVCTYKTEHFCLSRLTSHLSPFSQSGSLKTGALCEHVSERWMAVEKQSLEEAGVGGGRCEHEVQIGRERSVWEGGEDVGWVSLEQEMSVPACPIPREGCRISALTFIVFWAESSTQCTLRRALNFAPIFRRGKLRSPRRSQRRGGCQAGSGWDVFSAQVAGPWAASWFSQGNSAEWCEPASSKHWGLKSRMCSACTSNASQQGLGPQCSVLVPKQMEVGGGGWGLKPEAWALQAPVGPERENLSLPVFTPPWHVQSPLESVKDETRWFKERQKQKMQPGACFYCRLRLLGLTWVDRTFAHPTFNRHRTGFRVAFP